MKKNKQYLTKNLWEREDSDYYSQVEISNRTHLFDSAEYKILAEKLSNKLNKVRMLDVGCGDGSKTFSLQKMFGIRDIYGIDISSFAINKGRKEFLKFNLVQGDIEKLPYENNFFDFVITNYVLEHTQNPLKVINEIIRVTKKDGYFAIICPNYGSPNRCSPPNKDNRLKKLLIGGLSDVFIRGDILGWNNVEPLSTSEGRHISDFDTTVEPYILSLFRHLKKLNINVLAKESLWEDDFPKTLYQKTFKFLGLRNIYPFNYWGPKILVIARKK